MQKTLRSGLILLVMIPSLMTISACSKKVTTVEKESGVNAGQADSSSAKEPEIEEVEIKEVQRTEAQEREFRAAKIKFMYEDIYFKKGSYRLQSEARLSLKRKAEFLKKYPEVLVIIEGHTDERGSREKNIAFGDRRAGAVKSFLIREGIERYRLIPVSFGKERPIDTGTTEKARAKNRRVHFVIKE
ncbi:MAG: OmpA family protein [Desulfobacterales bacterium]|jgi:peptidoglycan-associated lipoprotein